MSSELKDLAKQIVDIANGDVKKKTRAYDTTATVTRVDGDTTYVHIPGGVQETPVKTTVGAKKGDVVQVRVANKSAWMVGNASAPPTDDTKANVARKEAGEAMKASSNAIESAKQASEAADHAISKATEAEEAATKAQEDAGRAATAAENAESSASAAETSAGQAQTSANSAGESASRSQAAAEAAQAAALGSITTDTLHYLATDQSSGVTTETAGWTTTVQQVTSANRYLWTYHTYTTAGGVSTDSTPVITGVYGESGSQGPAGPAGEQGDDGVSISSVQPQYYLSTSSSSATDGSWSASLSYIPGKFIWTRDFITYSDTSTGTSTEIYNQALTEACQDAAEALGLIESQQEYFWHDTLGAHILSDTDEVTGNRYRTDLKGAGQEIFELDGQTETSVASFGADGARLGETGGAHSIIDEDGQRFFASDGTTELANIGYGQGASESGTDTAPYYSFGDRAANSSVGNFSMAEGTITTASGYSSHAEGGDTTASADFSHAEGYSTTASGYSSHAEGGDTTARGGSSHAEGHNTTASGSNSHAEGYDTTASGLDSHAQNIGTIAAKSYQTAIGKYNTEDTETTTSKQKALIIGNGTSNTARSNAFDVDWEGNTEAAGDITDGSGNVLSDKADSSSLPEIDSGRTASITAAANGYKDLTVSFDTSFSSVPKVVCSIYSTSTAGAIGSLSCSALDVTTTGFKVRVFNAGSAQRSPAVDWIAINN